MLKAPGRQRLLFASFESFEIFSIENYVTGGTSISKAMLTIGHFSVPDFRAHKTVWPSPVA